MKAIRAGALVIIALFIFSCGNHNRTHTMLQDASSAPANTTQPQTQTLGDALAQLDALPVPEGVNPEVFMQLKAALREALECRARACTAPMDITGDAENGGVQAPALQRIVSTPPTGDANRVNDLAIADNGDGTYSLTWHYRNLGDYNQDGVVGIADITPLAMHYGEVWATGEENSLSAVVDGSNNKTVDIADVTPIAMNFGVDAASYRIESSLSQMSGYSEVIKRDFGTGTNGDSQRMEFSHSFAATKGRWYRVVPIDGIGSAGEPGSAVAISSPVEIPAAPSDLVATTVSSSRIDLTWQDNSSDETLFSIERKTDVGGLWSEIGQVTANIETYPNSNLLASTTYYYRVRAANSAGSSDYANEAFATTDQAPLEAPFGLQASDGSYTDKISLQWSHPTVGPTPDGYYVFRAAEQGGTYTLQATIGYANQWDDTAVPDKSAYWYQLQSYKSGYPDSAFSGEDGGFMGAAWHIAPVDSNNDVGEGPTLKMVNGKPAISYYDETNGDLKYVQANDTYGSSWGAPVIVDSAGTIGAYASLEIVNGNPAISYWDFTNRDLKFVRASDADGATWDLPQTIDSDGLVGEHTSLEVISGNPAISYFDSTNGALKYVRAANADGTTWNAPKTLDSGGLTGSYSSLAVVNGCPAISYFAFFEGDLKYIQAQDAIGDLWNAPVTIDSSNITGWHTCLVVINGYPAISYYDVTSDDLNFARANDVNGQTWPTIQTLDSINGIGLGASMAVINGNPAVSYYDVTNSNLKYIRANDESGVSWNTPELVDSVGDVGIYTSLIAINGCPAMGYYDSTNGDLKFAVFY